VTHLDILLLSAVLSSRTGPAFSLGCNSPSLHSQTLTCAAT